MLKLVYSRDRDVVAQAPAPTPDVPAMLVPALTYWKGLRRWDIPYRTDIDASRLSGYLPRTAVFERTNIGWVCRISGSMLTAFGLERGDRPRALLGGDRFLDVRMEDAARKRSPWLVAFDYADVLVLPLRSSSSEADRSLVIVELKLCAPVPAALRYQSDRMIQC